MFTSDTDKNTSLRTAIIYLACSAFCGLFSSVYGKYAHGVSSDYMVFLSLVPLILGVLPYTAMYLFKEKESAQILKHIYNCGVATICVGCCLKGVFDIYGSECFYIPFYFGVGAFLIILAITAHLIKR